MNTYVEAIQLLKKEDLQASSTRIGNLLKIIKPGRVLRLEFYPHGSNNKERIQRRHKNKCAYIGVVGTKTKKQIWAIWD